MRQHHRDDVVALAIVALVVGLAFFGSRFHAFRVFFAWPDGGTWSNTVAWIEDGLIAVFVTWYFRNNVGRRLARWWNEHRIDHVAGHIQDLHDHVTDEMFQLVTWLRSELDDHHGKIITAVDDRISGVNHTSGSADGENAP